MAFEAEEVVDVGMVRREFLGKRSEKQRRPFASLGVQSRHLVDRIDDKPVWL
jgi:hypothetical protein